MRGQSSTRGARLPHSRSPPHAPPLGSLHILHRRVSYVIEAQSARRRTCGCCTVAGRGFRAQAVRLDAVHENSPPV